MAARDTVTLPRPWTGVALVLFGAAAFAISPTAARVAFDAGSNPLTVVTLRGVLGGVVLAVLLLVLRQSLLPPRGALLPAAGAGLANAVVAYGALGAVYYIPVSLALLVFFTHPLMIAALWHWRGGERLTPRKLGLALVVLAGLALALGTAFDNLNPTGLALSTLAALSMAGVIAGTASAQREASSTQVNFCMTVVSAAVLLVATTAFGAWSLPAGAIGWLGLAGTAVGVTFGLLGFLAAFRFIGPVRATMLSNVEPLLGILFAMAVLGEHLSRWQWCGVALVIAGLVLFEMPRRHDRG
jgi:drug/metabolite transporter (DMT)-like permease